MQAHPRSVPEPLLVAQPGIRFALANALIVIALIACRLSGVGVAHSVLVVATLGGVAVAGLGPVLAAGAGVIAWAFVTGFVENRYATLTLHPRDLLHLGTAVAVTVLVAELVAELVAAALGRRS